MGINEQIQQDLLQILTNPNELEVIILTAPTSPLTVLSTFGTSKHHHTDFNELGMVSGNRDNATCTVSILALQNANYPFLTKGVCDFRNHLVTLIDSLGTNYYEVSEWYPDEGQGLIVLKLDDYSSQ